MRELVRRVTAFIGEVPALVTSNFLKGKCRSCHMRLGPSTTPRTINTPSNPSSSVSSSFSSHTSTPILTHTDRHTHTGAHAHRLTHTYTEKGLVHIRLGGFAGSQIHRWPRERPVEDNIRRARPDSPVRKGELTRLEGDNQRDSAARFTGDQGGDLRRTTLAQDSTRLGRFVGN